MFEKFHVLGFCWKKACRFHHYYYQILIFRSTNGHINVWVMHCLYHPVILECVLKSEYYFQLSNSPERLPQNFYQIESFLPIQALARYFFSKFVQIWKIYKQPSQTNTARILERIGELEIPTNNIILKRTLILFSY